MGDSGRHKHQRANYSRDARKRPVGHPGPKPVHGLGCSLGKRPDTPTMTTGSDDDSRDSVRDRCLCIAA